MSHEYASDHGLTYIGEGVYLDTDGSYFQMEPDYDCGGMWPEPCLVWVCEPPVQGPSQFPPLF